MPRKNSPQYVIKSYKRKGKFLPFVIWGLAAIIFALGVLLIYFWFMGSDSISTQPTVDMNQMAGTPSMETMSATSEPWWSRYNPVKLVMGLFASPTPTPTSTFTMTPTVPTSTPTLTATITLTPTATITPTPDGPQEYVVEEGDNCWYIATEKFKVPMDVFLAINGFTMQNCSVSPGQTIFIPGPDTKLPTETPISLSQYTAGQQIEYEVKLNDSLRDIVSRFNTTYEDIVRLNNLTDENETLRAGQILLIAVNLVTPTPTPVPTFTQIPE